MKAYDFSITIEIDDVVTTTVGLDLDGNEPEDVIVGNWYKIVAKNTLGVVWSARVLDKEGESPLVTNHLTLQNSAIPSDAWLVDLMRMTHQQMWVGAHTPPTQGETVRGKVHESRKEFMEQRQRIVSQLGYGVQAHTEGTCERCGTALNKNGYCADETCPFSDHKQDCPAGWTGHPERAHCVPFCTCHHTKRTCERCGATLNKNGCCVACHHTKPVN